MSSQLGFLCEVTPAPRTSEPKRSSPSAGVASTREASRCVGANGIGVTVNRADDALIDVRARLPVPSVAGVASTQEASNCVGAVCINGTGSELNCPPQSSPRRRHHACNKTNTPTGPHKAKIVTPTYTVVLLQIAILLDPRASKPLVCCKGKEIWPQLSGTPKSQQDIKGLDLHVHT